MLGVLAVGRRPKVTDLAPRVEVDLVHMRLLPQHVLGRGPNRRGSAPRRARASRALLLARVRDVLIKPQQFAADVVAHIVADAVAIDADGQLAVRADRHHDLGVAPAQQQAADVVERVVDLRFCPLVEVPEAAVGARRRAG